MEDYSVMDQDLWWRSGNLGQGQYYNGAYNEPYYYDPYHNESYDDDPYDEPYDNDWRWNDNVAPNHDHVSPYFPDYQESDESSYNKKLDKILDLIEIISKKEENYSSSLSAMERQLQLVREQLIQQLSDDLSDTTQEKEVSFLCSGQVYDNKVHKPTPPELEVVMEDYVSLNDKDVERKVENIDAVIELASLNEEFHKLEESKVGERSVEANTTPYPTNLKKHQTQLLVVIDSKRPYQCKQPNVIIDHPFLETIHANISCREGVIDVTFGNHKVGLLLLEPTNYSPISGDLYVINTIHDDVNEHNANMLSDTTQYLEKALSCNRSMSLDKIESQQVEKDISTKKHNVTLTNNSKKKVFRDSKHQVKKSIQKNYAWLFVSRFKRPRGRIKCKRVELHNVKDGMPHYMVTQTKVSNKMVGFQKSRQTYDPG